jgi:hypothetical protein
VGRKPGDNASDVSKAVVCGMQKMVGVRLQQTEIKHRQVGVLCCFMLLYVAAGCFRLLHDFSYTA